MIWVWDLDLGQTCAIHFTNVVYIKNTARITDPKQG